jgi:predicted DNA-binding transcriptional regulator AlpA
MSANATTKRLLNADELAAYIGTTTENVYQMKSKGDFPDGLIVKIGRSLRFDKPAVDLWIEGMKSGNQSGQRRA